jgi:hypothetical protein
MSEPRNRTVGLIAVLTCVSLALGLLVFWGIRAFLSGVTPATPPPGAAETHSRLAAVPVTARPIVLAWSPDGTLIAAGTGQETADNEVFVVDPSRPGIEKTLRVTGPVRALAFVRDGKFGWLAVATGKTPEPAGHPAELVVFDVPGFAATYTAKAECTDLAWSDHGKTLWAIDHTVLLDSKPPLRGWGIPGFAELPAIRAQLFDKYEALAVSPGGGTLAVIEPQLNEPYRTRSVRLIDVATGAERAVFQVPRPLGAPRLGFTPDGKAVGVCGSGGSESDRLFWRDAATGRPVNPDPARFAVAPAGLGAGDVHSADGRWRAVGSVRPRGPGVRTAGVYVELTDVESGDVRTWRVGDAEAGGPSQPVLAFSPDGTKLAGTVDRPGGTAVVIWAVPR